MRLAAACLASALLLLPALLASAQDPTPTPPPTGPTVRDVIAASRAALAAKAAAGQKVAASQAQLTADQQADADALRALDAADAALLSAVSASGPVIDDDGSVYEVLPGSNSLRVFTPARASSLTVPPPAPASGPPPPAVTPRAPSFRLPASPPPGKAATPTPAPGKVSWRPAR